MVSLKSFRTRGPSFADLVPYAGLVDNGVILLKDGSLMAAGILPGLTAKVRPTPSATKCHDRSMPSCRASVPLDDPGRGHQGPDGRLSERRSQSFP